MLEIETRTTARIPVSGLSAILGLAWFPDSSALLVAGKDSQTNKASLWQVSLSENFAQKLRQDVLRAAASPDSKRIAFVDDSGRRVWLMTADGSDSQVLFSGDEGDSIREIMWSPDGKHILLAR